MVKLKRLFDKPKDKRIAKIVTIKTPQAFRNSIRILSKDGITTQEAKALRLARARASIQLKRPNLSPLERKEMRAIKKTKIPKITKR